MICRLWRGWTTTGNAGAYERIVRGEVIPGIEARRIPGFRSIDLVRRERDHDVEFMTLMWFDTLDSVKEFMGEDYSTTASSRCEPPRRRCPAGCADGCPDGRPGPQSALAG